MSPGWSDLCEFHKTALVDAEICFVEPKDRSWACVAGSVVCLFCLCMCVPLSIVWLVLLSTGAKDAAPGTNF